MTSVVYELPFGKGRQFGRSMNPGAGCCLRRLGINAIITANTGTPLDVSYTPSAANDVTGLTNDYRGEAILRPNVSGSASARALGDDPQLFRRIHVHHAAGQCPFGNLGRNAFRAPDFGSGI